MVVWIIVEVDFFLVDRQTFAWTKNINFEAILKYLVVYTLPQKKHNFTLQYIFGHYATINLPSIIYQ